MKRACHTRKQTTITVMMFYCWEYWSKPTMANMSLGRSIHVQFSSTNHKLISSNNCKSSSIWIVLIQVFELYWRVLFESFKTFPNFSKFLRIFLFWFKVDDCKWILKYLKFSLFLFATFVMWNIAENIVDMNTKFFLYC